MNSKRNGSVPQPYPHLKGKPEFSPPAKRRTEWIGGRIRYDAKDRPVYIIRRRIGGTRYEISTHCHDERAAFEHLRRFEMDPEAYDPAGGSSNAIYIEKQLIQEYLDYSAEIGNTIEWRGKQRRFLVWWSQVLKGRNLRKVDLDSDILPALQGQTTRHHRISAIKGLYTWMRKVRKRITAAEDPVIDLEIPQYQPAQATKSKVIPREHVLIVIDHLTSPWREALTIQAGTGWHTTEIYRFARSGSIEDLPPYVKQEGVAGVLVGPKHKSGVEHRARVSETVLSAAKKLLDHGSFSRQWYDRAVKAACACVKLPDGKIGVPKFTPGRLRHTVSTWALNNGADLAAVSTFEYHTSETQRRFYSRHASPKKVPTLL
jgi:integrase